MTLPQRHLDYVARHARTGDLLLFRGTSLFSKAIRLCTGKPYSHVAVLVKLSFGGRKRLYALEAMEGVGVRLMPLSLYIPDCHRRGVAVHLYRVTDPRIDRKRLATYCFDQMGRPYVSFLQLCLAFLSVPRLVRKLLGLPVPVLNPDRYYCSRIVAKGAQEAGYSPLPCDAGTFDPEATSPGDCAAFPFVTPWWAIVP